MKKFTANYKISQLNGPIFSRYFGNLKPCVYDIETSGLSSQTARVILTAMLIPCENGVSVTQFLAENHYEENRVLESTARFMDENGVGYLITYNGLSFDIPFTNRRFEALGMPRRLTYYNFDVFRFLKRHSTLPSKLNSMAQKSVEEYFDIGENRRDTIDGRKSVELFNEYARSGSPVPEKLILTHNREDVLQLYKILLASGHGDFAFTLRDGSLHAAVGAYGFPICGGALTAKPKITSNSLRINGRQTTHPFNGAHFRDYDADISVEFSGNSMSYSASLPLYREGNSLFADLAPLRYSRRSAETLRLRELNGFVNDYLILSENGNENHEEINALSELLMEYQYNELCR